MEMRPRKGCGLRKTCSLMLKWVKEKMFLGGWIVVEERM
jgi:hypothetical protein